MKCLAVNTATTILSVALRVGDDTAYHFATPETRDQGNLLLTHAQQALAAAGIGFDDLDLLATVTGPGSFTGIRIGLSGMRGMALAARKPLMGLTSFDLFSVNEPDVINVIAVESWRAELYFQIAGQPPVNETPEVFATRLKDITHPILVSGDAADKLLPFITGATVHQPTAGAAELAARAVARYTADGDASVRERPAPFYLRPADVTLKAIHHHIEGM